MPNAEAMVDRDRDFDEIQELMTDCNKAIHLLFDDAAERGETPGLFEAAAAVTAWAANIGYAACKTEEDPADSKKIIAMTMVAGAKTIAAIFGAEGSSDVEMIQRTGVEN